MSGSAHTTATLSDVRDDLRSLRQDVATCVCDAKDVGIGAIRHGAEAAHETTRTALHKAAEAHETVRTHVSEHPATAILVAIGVGAIASRLLFPRRS